MTNNITIGKYYDVDSVIHMLDPRVKLFATLLFIISLFIIKNPVLYIFSLITILVLYYLSKVPFLYFLSGLKGIIILLLFTFIFRVLYTPGEIIFRFSIFKITNEGIIKAISMTSRIALMIIAASLLSYTSTPKDLSNGLEKSFMFLEKLKIPISDMMLITMIAFRFIPILLSEFNTMTEAHISRGSKIEDGNIIEKCKCVYEILLPFFLSALKKVSDLATAMIARGYTGDSRHSKMYPLRYKKNDYLGYIFIFTYFIVCILLSFI